MRTISSWHKDPTRCDVTFSLHGTEIRCRLASQSFSYLQLGYIEQLPDCTWRRATDWVRVDALNRSCQATYHLRVLTPGIRRLTPGVMLCVLPGGLRVCTS